MGCVDVGVSVYNTAKAVFVWVGEFVTEGVSVDRIGARLARASEEELARVLDGLNEILG